MTEEVPQNTLRVATADFWRKFHHEGKLAQPGEGGGRTARPPPFTLFVITYKVAVYAPTERADTLTLFYYFISTPICTLWEVQHSVLCTKTKCPPPLFDPLYINLCLKKAGGIGKIKKIPQKEERGE